MTLLTDHCDLWIRYQPNETNSVSIVLRSEEDRIFESIEVVLVVAESAQLSLPAGTPFGDEGDPIWVLPQSQDPDLLYLGISAERIAPGVFAGAPNFRLKHVEGPGHFFSWQANEFGGLDVKMNSRDGIQEEDKATPVISSHEHLNWGFTAPGVYRVTFQLDARQVGETTNLVSEPATFTFHVLPLPTNPDRATIELADPKLTGDGNLSFHLIGAANLPVQIQATEDFAQWVTVTNVTAALSPQPFAIPIERRVPYKFFRAVTN